MRRREFISLLPSAVACWSHDAGAQVQKPPVIGFLRSASATNSMDLVSAFRLGLGEAGFIEGQNIVIEYRWAEGRVDQLPALATDLVQRQVAAIVASGNEAAVAAKAASATVPIIFALGDDPVRLGLVASLARPGSNLTGVTFISTELTAKRMQVLRDLVPQTATIAYLMNSNSVGSELELQDVQKAAGSLGLQVLVFRISRDEDFIPAFQQIVDQRLGALLVGTGAFFFSRAQQLAALAARHAIPAMFEQRAYITAGGLISYGNSITHAYRQVGLYVSRILKGTKPADMAVEQPTRFEMVINLKTAKTLGLTIAPFVLTQADEIID